VVFKLRVLLLVFIFLGSFFIISPASELILPLPDGAVKVAEKATKLGPLKLSTLTYKTSLSVSKILNFYKKKLSDAGWRQKKLGVFAKGKYLLNITCNPGKDKNKGTEFSITSSVIPQAREIMAERKSPPDKLIFMPVYPGSEQIFLWGLPGGAACSYETGDSVKEVVFFYKAAMLNYGWSLADEHPSGVSFGNGKLGAKEVLNRVKLLFRRPNGEACRITVTDLFVDLAGNNVPKNGRTPARQKRDRISITVNYDARKNAKP
jgi:hypothetical protein